MMLHHRTNGGKRMRSRIASVVASSVTGPITNSNRRTIVLFLILLSISACSGSKTEPVNSQAVSSSAVPAEYAKGEAGFNKYCAPCHGLKAAGTDHGPTFISQIYQPNHHGDAAFRLAPMNGVRAHHWQFGDMP